jgi:hypothetical protein
MRRDLVKREMTNSKYQFGWDALAEYAGLSRSNLFNHKEALLNEKVVEIVLKGFPPRRVMRWHPDKYDRFIEKKNDKNLFL